jgi:hypothetical protein
MHPAHVSGDFRGSPAFVEMHAPGGHENDPASQTAKDESTGVPGNL